jgi:DNA repair protein RadA/Sms
LDSNRLSLLLAVLEKRVGYPLYQRDVFVSVAGGVRITEPAIDLGILLAIASSLCNKAIHSETVVVGEVGLGGEIRSVSRIEQRIKEAAQMGFQRCLIPKRNLKGLPSSLLDKITVKGVEFVEEAIDALIS